MSQSGDWAIPVARVTVIVKVVRSVCINCLSKTGGIGTMW